MRKHTRTWGLVDFSPLCAGLPVSYLLHPFWAGQGISRSDGAPRPVLLLPPSPFIPCVLHPYAGRELRSELRPSSPALIQLSRNMPITVKYHDSAVRSQQDGFRAQPCASDTDCDRSQVLGGCGISHMTAARQTHFSRHHSPCQGQDRLPESSKRLAVAAYL